MIKIIIIIVILILFISLILILLIKSKKLIKESGGQYVSLVNGSNKILPSVSQIDFLEKPFNYYFKNAIKRLRERTILETKDEIFNVKSSHRPSYISDANIDLLYLYYQNLIDSGVGVCELNSLTYDHKNNMVSELESNNYSIKKQHTFQEINKENIQVYIEFVYSNINNIPKVYKKIHMKTFEILEDIMKTNDNYKIFIYRIHVDKDEVNREEEKFKDENIIIKVIHPENKFQTLIIPFTKKDSGCSFDEYLHFKATNGKTYDVQIEHSEALDNHKSDALTFILQTTDSEELINKYLMELGYEMVDGKFRCKLKGEKFVKMYTGTEEQNKWLKETYYYNLNPEWFDKYVLINKSKNINENQII